MLYAEGNKIYMNYGDYGIMLPLAITSCCADCDLDLLDTDTVIFELTTGEEVILERTATWKTIKECGNVFPLELSRGESERMMTGKYIWRVRLQRENDTRNTLVRSVWEVMA